MSTNHKDIGILYLFTAGFVGLISVIFTVYMRMELMEPGVQYMCTEGARLTAAAAGECTPDGHLWNVMITGHGVLMMFFVVIPALFGGFGNYFMPLMIGAPDIGGSRAFSNTPVPIWLPVCAADGPTALSLLARFSFDVAQAPAWTFLPAAVVADARPAARSIARFFAVHRSRCAQLDNRLDQPSFTTFPDHSSRPA